MIRHAGGATVTDSLCLPNLTIGSQKVLYQTQTYLLMQSGVIPRKGVSMRKHTLAMICNHMPHPHPILCLWAFRSHRQGINNQQETPQQGVMSGKRDPVRRRVTTQAWTLARKGFHASLMTPRWMTVKWTWSRIPCTQTRTSPKCLILGSQVKSLPLYRREITT